MDSSSSVCSVTRCLQHLEASMCATAVAVVSANKEMTKRQGVCLLDLLTRIHIQKETIPDQGRGITVLHGRLCRVLFLRRCHNRLKTSVARESCGGREVSHGTKGNEDFARIHRRGRGEVLRRRRHVTHCFVLYKLLINTRTCKILQNVKAFCRLFICDE